MVCYKTQVAFLVVAFAVLTQCSFIESVQNVLDLAVGFNSGEDKAHRVHYTEVSESEWPIDLSQYTANTVFRISYEDETSRGALVKSIKLVNGCDIWSKSTAKKFIDIRFKDESTIDEFWEALNNESDVGSLKFEAKPMISDLPQAIYETYESDQLTINDMTSASVDLFFKAYRSLEMIYQWMDLLVATYPNLVTVEYVGRTFEGREMRAVHISTESHEDNPERKTIVITGGLHAREWISVSSACYGIYEFLRRYEEGRKKEVFFLHNLDFIFVPVMNPDGYAYTWSEDRLWRKNRQETYMSSCRGIDIDHSFDYHWQRSDDPPCGEDYSGEESFESVESEIWNTYLNKTKSHLEIYGYIDLHSYAQEVLYPYAYSCEQRPRDAENLIELAYGLSKAIRLKSGKHYDVLSACVDKDVDLMPSLGSGSALDFMYHNRADWAFQIKLRDSGSHGFLLPPKYIVPVGTEIFSSIRYFCNFVLSNT